MLRDAQGSDDEGGGQRARVQGLNRHQREPQRGTAEVGEKQDGQDRVVADGVLREQVVAAEEEGGDKAGGDPRHERGSESAGVDRRGMAGAKPVRADPTAGWGALLEDGERAADDGREQLAGQQVALPEREDSVAAAEARFVGGAGDAFD